MLVADQMSGRTARHQEDRTMATLSIGQRISYTRKGKIHHGEIVRVETNRPFSDVAYTVRTDEHGRRCDFVLPKAILEVSATR